jgi:hypothetical protein
MNDRSLVEVTHELVFFRDSHRLKINVVPHCLEITTDQEQVYFVLLLVL